jgi:hypothetical protein
MALISARSYLDFENKLNRKARKYPSCIKIPFVILYKIITLPLIIFGILPTFGD